MESNRSAGHTARPKNHPNYFVRVRLRHPVAYDLLSMAVYILLVYGLSIHVGPLGRDFSVLANPQEELSGIIGKLVSWERDSFGSLTAAYHLASIATMYLCMVMLFFITKKILNTPYWMGTLAGTLFMANPAYGEAILNVTGISHIFPAFACLFVLLTSTYAYKVPVPKRILLDVVIVFPISLMDSQLASLPWILFLFERFVKDESSRSRIRAYTLIVLGMVCTLWNYREFVHQLPSTFPRLGQLYFLIYPIGLTTDSAFTLHRFPILGYLGALALILILIGICQKVQSKALLWGIIATVIMQLTSSSHDIDSVHLVGAGKLLVPSVFFHFAFVALVAKMMENPKWRVTLVTTTTLLCVIYFSIQIKQVIVWRRVSNMTKVFQTLAHDMSGRKEEPFGVCPDYRYFAGVPMCLSDSIAYDTPFSRKLNHVVLLPLNFTPKVHVILEERTSNKALIRVRGASVREVIPPKQLARLDTNKILETPTASYELVERNPDNFVVQIYSKLNLPQEILIWNGGERNRSAS